MNQVKSNKRRSWGWKSLTAVALAFLFAVIPASYAFATYLAKVTNPTTTLSAGTMLLRGTTPTSVVCNSSGTSITTNQADCPGTPIGTGTLTTGATISGTTVVTPFGNTAPTAASVSSTTCGVAQLQDSGTDSNPAIIYNGVSYGAAGPLSGTAATFDGVAAWGKTGDVLAGPQNFTQVAWFKTSTNGTIMDFNDQIGITGIANHDRALWIDNTGHLVWGIYPGATQEITSPATYWNNAWHLAVVSVGAAGMKMSVDGTLVASNAGVTTAQVFNGYWHLGWGSESSGWTNPPTNPFFTGSLAHVAVLPVQLTNAQVTSLYASGTLSAFTTALSGYSPTEYWPMTDTGGAAYTGSIFGVASTSPTLADTSGNGNNGVAMGAVSLSTTGPLAGNSITFPGTAGSYVQTTAAAAVGPSAFTQAGWFKTASTGTLVAWTTQQDDSSPGQYDRHLWVDDTGHLVFGVYPGAAQQITSPGTVNDGTWHYFTTSVGAAGMKLYVDGAVVASNTGVTTAEVSTGWWHLGWGSESKGGWTNTPTNPYYTGSLAQVAIFPTQLSNAQVNTLYTRTTAATYSTAVLARNPSAFWPLTTLPAAGVCTQVMTTVSSTASSGTTCLYPAGAGACPAISSANLLSDLGTKAFSTLPTAAAPATVTVNLRLTTASITGISGLHLLPQITYTTSRSSWTATVRYPFAQLLL